MWINFDKIDIVTNQITNFIFIFYLHNIFFDLYKMRYFCIGWSILLHQ